MMSTTFHKPQQSFSRVLLGRVLFARGALAAALAVVGASPWHVQADEPPREPLRVVAPASSSDEDQQGNAQENVESETERSAPPKLWLGVLLKGIEGDLASYLGSDQGVLIHSVFPDSPAEAAGLKKGDVLLKSGATELSGPADVSAELRRLDQSQEETPRVLKLTVSRQGEQLQIELEPTPRTKQLEAKIDSQLRAAGDGAEEKGDAKLEFSFSGKPQVELEALLKKMGEGLVGKEMQLFRLGDPAIVLVQEGESPEFSGKLEVVIKREVDGKPLQVTIRREPDTPAKITVQQGDDVQEYTEDQLEEMPVEARDLVEPVLKQKANRTFSFSGGGLKIDAVINEADAKELYRKRAEELRAQALEAAEGARAMADAVRRRDSGEVEKLKQQIEELRDEVKALRKELERP